MLYSTPVAYNKPWPQLLEELNKSVSFLQRKLYKKKNKK